MEDKISFVIDTAASTDRKAIEPLSCDWPIFSNSKFSLGVDREEGSSDEDSHAALENDSGDEYLGLPPPTVRINDALESCPIKLEYFKTETSKPSVKSQRKINDKLLNSLDDYLSELRPKKYSFVTDGIESKKDISNLGMTDSQLKRANRKEREKTKGANWFNMKAPEITEELKNDIQVVQMRSALDPKHFYKRNEMKTIPKYFEMGQVIESPVEYHNSKDVRKTKRSLVDELLEDAEFQKYNKRKFQEMAEQKKQTGFNKAMKKMRKLKKKRA